MSYLTQDAISASLSMRVRVAQCAAQEGQTDDPDQWAYDNRRTWAAAPGWDGKWESAVAGGVPDPGADPAVISDGDILAVVQPMLAGMIARLA